MKEKLLQFSSGALALLIVFVCMAMINQYRDEALAEAE